MPAGLLRATEERQFCCAGCRTVWDAIQGSGLGDYYRLRQSLATETEPARTTGRPYQEFDDPTFAQAHVREHADGRRSCVLLLEGVHCAACVWLVEKLPLVHPGVTESRLDFGRRTLDLSWAPSATSLSAIARSLDRLGYPPHPFRGGDADQQRRVEDRRQLIRVGIAGALAMNTMLLAFALYGGWFHGMEQGFRDLFRWTSFALAMIAVLGPGRVFLRGALAALRTRTPHMDLPIALGIGAGLLGGGWNTWRGAGEVYFESVTALVFLLLVGRMVQQRQQRRAYDALSMLYSLTPGRARRLQQGEVSEVPTASLQAGDLVEVRAGESVPADGVLVCGRSPFDLSLLSGESRPLPLGEGDRVHAGAVAMGARVVVRVERTGEQTRLGRLMQLVERHATRPAQIMRLADRWSGWFILAVLGLALVNFLAWSLQSTEMALEHTVALLIVACPCALGLATPLAVAAAVGRAAGHGILIKGGDVLEALARPGVLFLDKTGTLTEGRVRVVEWAGAKRWQAWLPALEVESGHVYARALVAAYGKLEGAAERRAQQVVETQGLGICGVVAGTRLLIGSPRFLQSEGVALEGEVAAAVEGWVEQAWTPVLVAAEGRLVAAAALGDAIRAEAREVLTAWKGAGWEVGLLSGDHPRVVAAVGRQLGLDPERCQGGMSPEEKLQQVRSAGGGRTTVMVGDGVNDAAALAAAGVGIAVHGGAEASLAAADVFLARPGLRPVAELFEGSRRCLRVIRRNLVLSALYNAAGVALAMAGWLSPAAAAVLMPLSSLTVVATSYRSRTFVTQP